MVHFICFRRSTGGLAPSLSGWRTSERVSPVHLSRDRTTPSHSVAHPALVVRDPENGFSVLRTKARGDRDLVTVVGHVSMVAPGEWITAPGEWIDDRTHGEQFKARFMRLRAVHGRGHREVSRLRDDPGHRAGLRLQAHSAICPRRSCMGGGLGSWCLRLEWDRQQGH